MNSKKQKHSKKKPLKNKTREISISLKHAVLLLVALVVVIYGRNIKFDYTYFDDDAIIIRNEAYISDINNFSDALLRDAEFQKKSIELYRPLQNVSYMIDVLIFGVNPLGFHFTNILLHLLNCILIFILLKKLRFSGLLALFGAVLYCVHPVFAFTVSWIPARGDLLLAFFGMLAILFYIRYTEKNNATNLVLYLISFLLAVLAKESAFMIVLITGSYTVLINKNFRLNLPVFIQTAVYLIIAIAYFYMRSQSVSNAASGAFGFNQFIANLPVIPENILVFFIPVNIAALPFYSTLLTLGGIGIITTLIIVLWRTKVNSSLMLWAAFWFLILTLPAMFYNPDWSDYIYEYLTHRTYFPMIGVLILVLLFVKHLIKKWSSKRVQTAMMIIIAVFMILNFKLAKNYSSPLAFWQYAVKTNPESAFSHLYLANAELMDRRYHEALKNFDDAITLKPDLQEAVINRGVVNMQLNQNKSAIQDFSRSLELDSTDIKALRYRADAYLKSKDYFNASKDFDKLIKRGEKNKDNVYSRGLSYLFLKDFSAAVEDFTLLINKYPDDASVLRIYAIANLLNGNSQEAVDKNRLLLRTDSSNFSTMCNLGYALWENKEPVEAQKIFKKAGLLNTGHIDVMLGQVLCTYSLGNFSEMETYKNIIIQLDPRFNNSREAIKALENEGYLFTEKQTETFYRVF